MTAYSLDVKQEKINILKSIMKTHLRLMWLMAMAAGAAT
jgi:hypothetical protein